MKPIKDVQHLLLNVILKIILEVYGQEKCSLENEKNISVEEDYKGNKWKRDLKAEELITSVDVHVPVEPHWNSFYSFLFKGLFCCFPFSFVQGEKVGRY